ncbi:putative uncharacterized protein DDB_G0277255 isoform X2 [Agrilus planipennis]|uniref:Uncharacterized protein n=1 Tax=Agrilus planipennis TaxID=224129 RepID=A0A1W4WXQ1_AGRPL|nr:putative uncharacterized protein DDB_G0277255 isoform X2 [Agrilus planipennis]
MAPSPENDNAPKAPDKNEKCREETRPETRLAETENATAGPENKEASVSRLDDGQLKALLDEAITYKSPKDRVGKSQLFQNLLAKAEEDDRKARATSASGSELVRHYNRSATRRNRHCKDQNNYSIAENVAHGGSLNNLAKDELYNATINPLYRPPKTVSARQRQGGSLPCNVNAGLTPTFFEETRKMKESNQQQLEYTAIDMESESLLEHDSLNQDYAEQEMEMQPKFSRQYTSRATIEIAPKTSCGVLNSSSNVDDAVMVSALERCEKTSASLMESVDKSSRVDSSTSLVPAASLGSSASMAATAAAAAAVYPTNYTFVNVPASNWTCNKKPTEEKKVDENGNALGQGAGAGLTATAVAGDAKKNKKKKLQTDKNVRVLAGKDVEGHRSDIIHDVDKLIEYIGGEEEVNKSTSSKSKSGSGGGNVHKTKLNKQHASNEEKGGGSGSGGGGSSKKQRVRAKSKGENLQKSSSMEEISSTKLEDFDSDGTKVPLRNTKSNVDRPRERRSWGNSDTGMDFEQIQNLQIYPNASAENLETADFHVVTKKKKSKKRRNNSLSGRRQMLHGGRESGDDDFGRRRSPEPRKSARSVPQSEKSNDSSDDEDRDSVRSLPVTSDRISCSNHDDDDDLNVPVSYADIARNSGTAGVATAQEQQRPRWNRPPSERRQMANATVSQPLVIVERLGGGMTMDEEVRKQSPEKTKQQDIVHNPKSPPDVNSLQNWPTITNNNNVINNNNNNKVVCTTISATTVTPDGGGAKERSSANVAANKQKNITNAKNIKNNNNSSSTNHFVTPPPSIKDNKTNKTYNKYSEPMQMIRNSSEMMNNASNLPHDVPDVQTIEKMHLQNVYAASVTTRHDNNVLLGAQKTFSPPQQQQQHHFHQSVRHNAHAQHQQQQIHQQQYGHVSKTSPAAAVVVRAPSQNVEPPVVMATATAAPTNVGVVVPPAAAIVCCDSSNNIKRTATMVVVEGGGAAATAPIIVPVSVAPPPPPEDCDRPLRGNGGSSGSSRRTNVRPAVVILSGNASKGAEVSGLTFGFEVNEQLLSDDVCERFAARFVAPQHDVYRNHQRHGYEKIVNFIGKSWDEIVNQMDDKVKYYSDQL